MAPMDLMLRQVHFTQGDVITAGGYLLVVSTDPDLTAPDPAAVSTAFQLTAFLDASVGKVPLTQSFENLAFPLLKGQSLYLGGGGIVIFQLIFS